MKKTQDFTQGAIVLPLIRFALPVLAALFLQTMYGAVDLLVVGQYASAADVSAVSTGSQLMQTMTVLISGLAMGITILIGQYMGQKAPERAAKAIGGGIWLFAIVAVIMTGTILLLAEPMAALLQAPQEAFSQTVAYIRICAVGFVCIAAYNVLGSILRGLGDSKMPLVSVMIACVCNIAGDFLLVAVFHMGTAGAAIATVAAQAVSVAVTLWIILKRGLPFTMRKEYIRLRSGETGRILKLGIPVALQDVLVSVSFLVLIAIVNAMGVIASAGVGVAEKLCGFIMLVPSAFMQSISVFVAQNIGAVQPQRARRTLGYGILMSILAGLIMAYAAFFHGDALSAIFARDTEIIQASAQYLKAYAIDTILTSFLFCFIGYFNGCGRTWFIMLQGIVGAFLVRIPVAYAISKISGVTLFMIGLATPSSSLVQILLCLIYYLILWRNEKKH